MATVGYLVLCLTAFLIALVLAGITHAAQAYLNPYPQKLFDGEGLGDRVLNEIVSPNYDPLGRYDQGGWWEFHSVWNYVLHAAGWTFAVLLYGVLNWDDRVRVMASTCAALGSAGLKPVFCS